MKIKLVVIACLVFCIGALSSRLPSFADEKNASMLVAAEPGNPPSPAQEVTVRLKNETGSDMHNVSVNFRGQVIDYGFIGKGEYSKYHAVDRAYGYAHVEWKADGRIKWVVPVDYVGEKELEAGHYTYIILPIEGQDAYWINCQKD